MMKHKNFNMSVSQEMMNKANYMESRKMRKANRGIQKASFQR